MPSVGIDTSDRWYEIRAPTKGEATLKISARNQLKGKIVNVQKGQTTAHVRIDIGQGVVVTSSITNEAVDELKLKVGDNAIAIIKASDVIVAK
jgi:molybdopterin-binding protein